MKKLFFVTFFFLIIKLFGNDYFYHTLSSGTIAPANDNETDVELVNEIIIFELFDDYFSVTVDFSFFNNGEAINLLVGFPYAADRVDIAFSNMQGKIFNFLSWVNDNPVVTINTPIEIDLSDQKTLGVNYAYTKEVFFPSQQITKTKVMFNSQYGRDGGYILASYLYGSGKGWYNCIGKAEIIVKNNSKYWIYVIKAGVPYHSTRMLKIEELEIVHFWDDNDLHFVMENFEPDYNDSFKILLHFPMFDIKLGALRQSRYSFFYWNTILKPKELWYLTKEQLRILRNLIYALYGYNFRDITLLNYFSSYFGSYLINDNFTENLLSDIDRKNIEIIQMEELKR
jgi:hypothetical protein